MPVSATAVGFPMKLSATPERAQGPAPSGKERTAFVLADGPQSSADAVMRFTEEGVV